MYSLWSFGIFFPILVCLDQDESGNHVPNHGAVDTKKIGNKRKRKK
jgi:hypothetical protein